MAGYNISKRGNKVVLTPADYARTYDLFITADPTTITDSEPTQPFNGVKAYSEVQLATPASLLLDTTDEFKLIWASSPEGNGWTFTPLPDGTLNITGGIPYVTLFGRVALPTGAVGTSADFENGVDKTTLNAPGWRPLTFLLQTSVSGLLRVEEAGADWNSYKITALANGTVQITAEIHDAEGYNMTVPDKASYAGHTVPPLTVTITGQAATANPTEKITGLVMDAGYEPGTTFTIKVDERLMLQGHGHFVPIGATGSATLTSSNPEGLGIAGLSVIGLKPGTYTLTGHVTNAATGVQDNTWTVIVEA